jgi:PKD repeat protein
MSTRRAWKVIPALLFLIPFLVVPTAAQDPAIPEVPEGSAQDSEILALTADNSAVVDHGGVTGDPIEGATVSVDLSVTNSSTTGHYSMALAAGTHDVSGSAFGYLPTTIPGMVANVEETVVRDIGLTAAPSSVVDGYVTDVATGWPLYASVDTNSPAGVVWTDPETGYYSISLPEGMAFDFHVEAWVPGYVPEDRVVGPLAGDTTENFGLDADPAACIAPGYKKTYGFFDDFGGGVGNWTMSGLWNFENEADACGSLVAPFPSSSNAVYYGIDGQCTYDTGAANSGELTLISPVTLPGFGGTLEFASYEQTECGGDCDYDDRYVEISIDGGTTWDTLGEGDTEGTWYLKAFDLAAYGGDDVLIRFRFDTVDNVDNDHFGWMVDHVAVATGCEPQAGGLVVGNVYDENTLGPVVGARVVNDIGGETFALPTPGDPNVDDAFYTLFSLPGDHLFTASFMPPYGTDDETVAVVDGATMGQDFYLPAPHLLLDAEELEVWVLTGTAVYSHVTGLDLMNDGALPLDFELAEISGTVPFAPASMRPSAAPDGASDSRDVAAFPVTPTPAWQTAGTGALLIQDYDAWGFPAITTILADNGIPYDVIGSAQIPTYDFSPYKMIIIPSVQSAGYNIVFNDNLAKFEDFVDAGGLMLMSFCEWYEPLRLPPFGGTNIWDEQSYNYIVEPGHPIFAGVPTPYYGNSASHNSLSDLLPDDCVLVTTGGVPGGNPVMIERDHGAGMLVAGGQTFEYGWGNGQDAGIILENMIPYYYFGRGTGVTDVPWFWEDPVSGTVPAETTENVTVEFTALYTDLTPMPLGDYYATLVVNSNDPVSDTWHVPVTMHIVEEYLAPIASFESNAPVCLGETTIFTNTTIPGIPPKNVEGQVLETTYLWDFGDGGTSTEFEPTHVYTAPGTYDVTLEACNPAGMCDTYEDTVEVLPWPQAGFGYEVAGFDVSFTNTSLDALSYEWDFGDGTGSTDENPVHTYAAADTYTVVLTATNECAIDVYSEQVEVIGLHYYYLPLIHKNYE